jgi:hypothetical protein
VIGRAFGAAVPAAVVVCAVAIAFAVAFVVFFVIGDEVIKGEPVVTRDQVNALLRLAFFMTIKSRDCRQVDRRTALPNFPHRGASCEHRRGIDRSTPSNCPR